MALALIKEDGSGLSDANSYASAADGDAYHEGHVNAAAWTGATTGQKEAALVMATRLMDAYFEFGGRKATQVQALQWPRAGCVDRDAESVAEPLRGWGLGGACFPSDEVPAEVVRACCEQARELIITDRTGPPLGEGLKSSRVGESEMVFDRLGRAAVLSRVTIALLRKVGVHLGDGGGVVKLVRA
jgi:hypothetical protein